MRMRNVVLVVVAAVVMFAAAAVWYVWWPEIAPGQRPTTFDPSLVAKGAKLAAVGNCISCHTVPGREAFAGGLPLPTPFGTIYSSNITPDPETGIGKWNETAFQRAMENGVDREGHHLYPVFPYDHFTLVTAADNKALYAYLMTRTAVRTEPQEASLRFPYSFRPLIAGWKLFYFDSGRYVPGTQQDTEWNRGKYLAEGLGHCGSCHTPRWGSGAEDRSRHFDGGEAEGWNAYPINATSVAPVPWTVDDLTFYLRHGYHQVHGVSRGPMAEVTANLGELPDADVKAIATYVVSLMGEPSDERKQRAKTVLDQTGHGPGRSLPSGDSQLAVKAPGNGTGEAIYTATCATCHESARSLPFGGMNFLLSTAVNADNPQNIINVTLFGLPPANGEASAVMPAFRGALSDQQLADVLAYMRQRFTDKPAWSGLADQVWRTRSGEHKVTVLPGDGIERGPENVGARK